MTICDEKTKNVIEKVVLHDLYVVVTFWCCFDYIISNLNIFILSVRIQHLQERLS